MLPRYATELALLSGTWISGVSIKRSRIFALDGSDTPYCAVLEARPSKAKRAYAKYSPVANVGICSETPGSSRPTKRIVASAEAITLW